MGRFMFSFEFKKQAIKDLKKLPKLVQEEILKKLNFYLSSDKPLSFAHRLINHEIGEYRFRMGNYRVIFDVLDEKIIILTIGHRRDIYK